VGTYVRPEGFVLVEQVLKNLDLAIAQWVQYNRRFTARGNSIEVASGEIYWKLMNGSQTDTMMVMQSFCLVCLWMLLEVLGYTKR
jgi:hypothetical protein